MQRMLLVDLGDFPASGMKSFDWPVGEVLFKLACAPYTSGLLLWHFEVLPRGAAAGC